MVEIVSEKRQFGIFNACGLKEFETREEILQHLKSNKYFVLYLNEDCDKIKHHPAIMKVQSKGCGYYSAIALIVNGQGMERFKDTFHRSSSYVDQRMIPYKSFKEAFSDEKDVVAFLEYIAKEFNDIQIKGMRQVFLRQKVVSQVAK